jgi:putative spermidine/putrescine transport system substrate-binding protein
MTRMFSMRRAAVLVAGLGLAFGAAAQDHPLTIIAGGGLQGDSVVKAFVEPFEKETGIKVRVIHDQTSMAKFVLQEKSGNVDFDISGATPAMAIELMNQGYLEKIDYSQLDPAVMAKLAPESKQPWGVANFIYSWVLGLDAAKFPPGQPAPASWADFWDVKKFPGTRTLQNGVIGSQSALEEALLADGVPAGKLYPLDLDRAFRSLDKIKPAIRKWWMTGSEQMQLFQSGGASMGMGYDGRFAVMTQNGKPMRIVWDGAKMTGLYWTIPKGAKNLKEAYQFISFSARAEQQAAYARLTGYSPVNPDAFKFIPKELAQTMVTSPENRPHAFVVDDAWYAQKGPDGKTNADRVMQRWNEWITK